MNAHTPEDGVSEERGDCRVDVYLTGVSAGQVDELVERIADLLADFGLAAEDEDADVRSLIGVKPVPWPDFEDEEAAARIADEYSEWVIPMVDDEDD